MLVVIATSPFSGSIKNSTTATGRCSISTVISTNVSPIVWIFTQPSVCSCGFEESLILTLSFLIFLLVTPALARLAFAEHGHVQILGDHFHALAQDLHLGLRVRAAGGVHLIVDLNQKAAPAL